MNTALRDPELQAMVGVVVGVLLAGSIAGAVLRRTVKGESGARTVANLVARVRAWWLMVAIFLGALALGRGGAVALYGVISFLALREFISVFNTRFADHRTLFWCFFVAVPAQYWLVYDGWYGLWSIFIPVYAFLFVPIRSALRGDSRDFLARCAKIQWGLMACVFCLSHAPALLDLRIPGYEGESAKLLFLLVMICQLSDVMQYVCGKLFGRRKIAPNLSPSKTWEGFVGGVAVTTGIGAALWWATPFAPWQAAAFALLICLLGFAGGLVMSAIKRDAGIKDWGDLIGGHGGMLDRIDSLCFATPVFYHLVRWGFTG
ncbi:MAG TPA: phosphatidate cytidylyltransferase [Planctomycetota bacterium]|nr:phosphatidate cytidylyltransferase [Planctomycetota bacterium]